MRGEERCASMEKRGVRRQAERVACFLPSFCSWGLQACESVRFCVLLILQQLVVLGVDDTGFYLVNIAAHDGRHAILKDAFGR